jgi:hypothetical protein
MIVEGMRGDSKKSDGNCQKEKQRTEANQYVTHGRNSIDEGKRAKGQWGKTYCLFAFLPFCHSPTLLLVKLLPTICIIGLARQNDTLSFFRIKL